MIATKNLGVLKELDAWAIELMARWGVYFLRVSLGVVFFWFGILKLFPGLSPAENLAMSTLDILFFGYIPSIVGIHALALLECLIGLGLIFGIFLRCTLFLLFVQMLGTLTPLLFFPKQTFIAFPYAPSLEGQYIIKNLVLISAGIVIGATVRGRVVVSSDRPDHII